MTVEQVLNLIFGNFGVLVVLLLILWSGYRGMWVWGSYAKELRDRIDKLESRLDRAGRVAESGTGLATRATQLAEDRRTEAPGG